MRTQGGYGEKAAPAGSLVLFENAHHTAERRGHRTSIRVESWEQALPCHWMMSHRGGHFGARVSMGGKLQLGRVGRTGPIPCPSPPPPPSALVTGSQIKASTVRAFLLFSGERGAVSSASPCSPAFPTRSSRHWCDPAT